MLFLLLADTSHLDLRTGFFFLGLRLDVSFFLSHLLLDIRDHGTLLPTVIELLHSAWLLAHRLLVIRLLAFFFSAVAHKLHVSLAGLGLLLLLSLLFLCPLRFSLSFPFLGLALLLLDPGLLFSLSPLLLLSSFLSLSSLGLSLSARRGFFGVFLLSSVLTLFTFRVIQSQHSGHVRRGVDTGSRRSEHVLEEEVCFLGVLAGHDLGGSDVDFIADDQFN